MRPERYPLEIARGTPNKTHPDWRVWNCLQSAGQEVLSFGVRDDNNTHWLRTVRRFLSDRLAAGTRPDRVATQQTCVASCLASWLSVGCHRSYDASGAAGQVIAYDEVYGVLAGSQQKLIVIIQ